MNVHEHVPPIEAWDFQKIGERFTCGECGNPVELAYDETYDPELGEEDGWFFYEEIGVPP